jgi:hypothetical protein
MIAKESSLINLQKTNDSFSARVEQRHRLHSTPGLFVCVNSIFNVGLEL